MHPGQKYLDQAFGPAEAERLAAIEEAARRPIAREPLFMLTEVGYGQAHERVRRARGNAREHRCVHCDGQAAHWAFRHGAPSKNVRHHKDGRPYSLDTADYLPLCGSCHLAYDGNGLNSDQAREAGKRSGQARRKKAG